MRCIRIRIQTVAIKINPRHHECCDSWRQTKMANLKPTPGAKWSFLRSWPIGRQPSVIDFWRTEKRLLEWRKKTREKAGLRSQFVEMSIGQDTFADMFLGMDNLARDEEWKWLKCQSGWPRGMPTWVYGNPKDKFVLQARTLIRGAIDRGVVFRSGIGIVKEPSWFVFIKHHHNRGRKKNQSGSLTAPSWTLQWSHNNDPIKGYLSLLKRCVKPFFLSSLGWLSSSQASFNPLLRSTVTVSKFLIRDQRSRICIPCYSTGHARGPAVFISMIVSLMQHPCKSQKMSSGRPCPSTHVPSQRIAR